MRDLSKVKVTIDGKLVATLSELQTLAYEVPEGELAPPIISALIDGKDLDPFDVYRAFEQEIPKSLGDSDAALEIARTIMSRLTMAFPDQIKTAN